MLTVERSYLYGHFELNFKKAMAFFKFPSNLPGCSRIRERRRMIARLREQKREPAGEAGSLKKWRKDKIKWRRDRDSNPR
jgi:hypothetical protein